jgi:hypothetical protein
MRTTSKRRAGLVLAACAITLAPGCGGAGIPDGSPQSPTGPSSPASTPSSAFITSAPQSTAPPAPPPPSLPSAADGSDLDACADADCTVQVRDGDEIALDSTFGLDTITVSSTRTDEVVLEFGGTAGGLEAEGMDVSVSGSCTNGVCRDEGELTLTDDVDGRINDILLRLAGTDDTQAVLTLTPR